MKAPRDDLPPFKHELRLVLEGQGPGACKMVLEAPATGERLRKHAAGCDDCQEIVRQLYPDGKIPVRDDS